MCEKTKMLVPSFSSFSHNDFYHMVDRNNHFINILFVICKGFQFGLVQNFASDSYCKGKKKEKIQMIRNFPLSECFKNHKCSTQKFFVDHQNFKMTISNSSRYRKRHIRNSKSHRTTKKDAEGST